MRKLLLSIILLCIPTTLMAQAISNSVSRTTSNPVTDAGPRGFYEQTAKPAVYPNYGACYGKVNPLTSKWALFCEDEDGVEYMLVPGGGVMPGAAQWCGVSAAAHDGNDGGSYAGANAYCTTIGTCTSGHVCNLDEMLDLIDQGSAFTGHAGQILWSNAGGPGYTAYATDCQGWTETSHTSPTASTYGNTFDFSGAQPLPFLGFCNSSYKYACCQ